MHVNLLFVRARRITGYICSVSRKGASQAYRKKRRHCQRFRGIRGNVNGVKCIFDYVSDIDYRGFKLNYAHYDENDAEKVFDFLTNLPISQKTVEKIIAWGRRRWGIENRGFNDQKNHGFYLEHLFSKNYWAMKNHYYLIQIAHMISQIVDAWSSIWEGSKSTADCWNPGKPSLSTIRLLMGRVTKSASDEILCRKEAW